MNHLETIPHKYLISKGTAFPLLEEGEHVPTIQLECYEYLIEEDEDGWYLAKCDELHSYTQGKTWEDLKTNILEVHSLMLDSQ